MYSVKINFVLTLAAIVSLANAQEVVDLGTGTVVGGATPIPVDPNLDKNSQEASNDLSVQFSDGRFCGSTNLKASNGSQDRDGSCSSTVQGAIPSFDKMVSTLIIEPANGADLEPLTPLTIRVRTLNMDLGHFSNPQEQYYAAPQVLNNDGIILGHQHVVVQRIDDLNTPLDAREFEFFKGLNADPDNNNDLSVVFDKGLPAGSYRLCSLTGTFTHQPVIMPVAQRGSQDDCIRFTVGQGTGAPVGAANAVQPPPAANGVQGGAKVTSTFFVTATCNTAPTPAPANNSPAPSTPAPAANAPAPAPSTPAPAADAPAPAANAPAPAPSTPAPAADAPAPVPSTPAPAADNNSPAPLTPAPANDAPAPAPATDNVKRDVVSSTSTSCSTTSTSSAEIVEVSTSASVLPTVETTSACFITSTVQSSTPTPTLPVKKCKARVSSPTPSQLPVKKCKARKSVSDASETITSEVSPTSTESVTSAEISPTETSTTSAEAETSTSTETPTETPAENTY